MKRRSFIRNISSLGLASVAVGTSFAAETPQSNSLPGKSKIPVYDGWDVIVVLRLRLRHAKVPKLC